MTTERLEKLRQRNRDQGLGRSEVGELLREIDALRKPPAKPAESNPALDAAPACSEGSEIARSAYRIWLAGIQEAAFPTPTAKPAEPAEGVQVRIAVRIFADGDSLSEQFGIGQNHTDAACVFDEIGFDDVYHADYILTHTFPLPSVKEVAGKVEGV